MENIENTTVEKKKNTKTYSLVVNIDEHMQFKEVCKRLDKKPSQVIRSYIREYVALNTRN